jgi:hypothetical protein
VEEEWKRRQGIAKGHAVSFQCDENVLKLAAIMDAHIYEYTNGHRMV